MAKRIALQDHCEVNRRSQKFARSRLSSAPITSESTYAGSRRQARTSTWPARQSSPSKSSSTGRTGPPKSTRRCTRSTGPHGVPFEWRPDLTAAVTATNPQLEGNVPVVQLRAGGTRGEVDTFTVTFNAADDAGFAFVTAR